jgi:hypothetical protein
MMSSEMSKAWADSAPFRKRLFRVIRSRFFSD